MAVVYPYVDGQVYTDGGRYTGDWVLDASSPVLTAAETLASGIYGVVDGQGRVAVPYPSAARTATPTSYKLFTRGATGVIVYVNATAITATPSVVVTIDGYNPVSDTWYNILTSAAITSVTTRKLTVAPGIAVTANLTASTILPDAIRVVMTHGDSDSITYSVSLDWIDDAGDELVSTGATTLVDAATIQTDASLDTRFFVTLTDNRTLANPTNPGAWQQALWIIRQDGTGGRTLAFDTKFRFGSVVTSATLSTDPDAFDYLGAIYNATDDKWDIIAFGPGYVT